MQNITRRIVDFCQPERVILFGSSARGEVRHDSDVDLLVVWDADPSLSDPQRYFSLRKAIGSVPVPLDLLTYTPAEFQKATQDPKSFTAQVTKEGKILMNTGTSLFGLIPIVSGRAILE